MRTNKKLDKLRQDLKNANSLTFEQVKALSKSLSSEAAGEYMGVRKDFFSEPAIKKVLVKLAAEHGPADPIILRDLISAVGFSATRYGQYDDQFYEDEFYELLVDNMNSRSNPVRMAIARFVPDFPQFEEYPMKWDYIVSIPKIPPKKDSKSYFVRSIQKRINDVPDSHRQVISDYLLKFIDEDNLDPDTRKFYEGLLEKLSTA